MKNDIGVLLNFGILQSPIHKPISDALLINRYKIIHTSYSSTIKMTTTVLATIVYI